MQLSKLTDSFAVSTQIYTDDVSELADAGYGLLINNRQDNESNGQPSSAELAAACGVNNIAYLHIPVAHGVFPHEAIKPFRDALNASDKPVIAFCEFGTRSAVLWASAMEDRLAADDIKAKCAQAGYDLSGILNSLIGCAENSSV